MSFIQVAYSVEILLQIPREFGSILKTRQLQETVAVPEVVALKDEEEEEEDEMEPEPQITKLVSDHICSCNSRVVD